MNIKIILEYDGTNYSGWAKQKNNNTIQNEIEKAIYSISEQKVEVYASGRTDAGVHSIGQTVNFHIDTKIPADKIKFALNQNLPSDIRVIHSEKVGDDFHSRFSASKKIYLYRIQTGEVKSVFEKNRSFFVNDSLDIIKMKESAKLFLGEKNFSAFKTDGSSAKNFVREIYSLEIREKNDIIEIEICGNGFLYNMVRIIVGTLVEIGKGRDLDINYILESKDRKNAGPTAPACGLYLKKVEY